MEGDLKNPMVSCDYTCVSTSASGSFTIPMPEQMYKVPANSSDWFPSGDQHSPLMYQGSFLVPASLCSTGQVRLQNGGEFTALLKSTDTVDPVHVRWHYRGLVDERRRRDGGTACSLM